MRKTTRNCSNKADTHYYETLTSSVYFMTIYFKWHKLVYLLVFEHLFEIMWFNLRKEPVVYINGQPHSPRDPADLHHNLNISHSMDEMDNLETYFKFLCKEKAEKNNGTLKVNKVGLDIRRRKTESGGQIFNSRIWHLLKIPWKGRPKTWMSSWRRSSVSRIFTSK